MNFDRNHVLPNKVVVETIRLLIDYTSVHKNTRVGVYLYPQALGSFSKFYSLSQLINSFYHFEEAATKGQPFLEREYPEEIEKIFGLTFSQEIENLWLLKKSFYFEHQPHSWFKDLTGYKFDGAFSVLIDPKTIGFLKAESLSNFQIGIKDFELRVDMRTRVSIR